LSFLINHLAPKGACPRGPFQPDICPLLPPVPSHPNLPRLSPLGTDARGSI
jgi:hypothetical protein